MPAIPLLVFVDTAPEVIEHAVTSGGDVQLAQSLTEQELCALLHHHARRSYAAVFGALVVAHPSASEAVFQLLWESMGKLSSVSNAIATSGRAPNSILRELLNHPSESVRAHAHLALITRELDVAPPTRFAELLELHGGDEGVSLGIRQRLACHPRTPSELLHQLADDDADFIADSAREQLSARERN
jgi:hypothetical protein